MCLGVGHQRSRDALGLLLSFAKDGEESRETVRTCLEQFESRLISIASADGEPELCAWVPNLFDGV